MRRILLTVLNIFIIGANIVPLQPLLVHAAANPVPSVIQQDYPDLYAHNPAPYADNTSADLLTNFVKPPETLISPSKSEQAESASAINNNIQLHSPANGLKMALPGGLSLSEPAILRELAALPVSLSKAPAPVAENTLLPAWFESQNNSAVSNYEPAPVLPSWFKTDSAVASENSENSLLPAWFETAPVAVNTLSAEPIASPLPAWFASPVEPQSVANRANVLPAWFSNASADVAPPSAINTVLPAWFNPLASPAKLPANRPLFRDIPLSLLTVDIEGPPVASLGSPVGGGEWYTVTIQNLSSDTAYTYSLSAILPPFFIYDGGETLDSANPAGSIPINAIIGAGTVDWYTTFSENLAPNQVLTLRFRLRATCGAQSGQQMRVGINYDADRGTPTGTEYNDSGINITTGRGNLVIKKEPAIRNLDTVDFGQPITWLLTVQNTGLGNLYNAVITDAGGLNLDISPQFVVNIPEMAVNEIRTYVVTGTVDSCNFTNVAEGAWLCGNLVGDATYTNPVESTASVLFTPDLPNVNIEVSSPITFPYCDPLTQTVTITVTNNGGPAGDFRLAVANTDGFLGVIPGTVSSSDWQYLPGTNEFSYTAAIALPGADGGPFVSIFTFDVVPTNTVCSAGRGDMVFTPLYNDVCVSVPLTGTPGVLRYEYAIDDAPTLNIDKIGPTGPVVAGQIYTYQIVIYGTNPQNISGTIDMTDFLPPEQTLITNSIVNTLGTVITGPSSINWQLDPTGLSSPFSHTLSYQVLIDPAAGGDCGASTIVSNLAQVMAQPACAGCATLSDDDQIDVPIVNQEGVSPGNSGGGNTETCGPGGFTLSNFYNISSGTVVTWTGAVFTEALGTPIGGGALPGPVYMEYQPGTLEVVINGTDYTADVNAFVTPGGQLRVELDGLQTAGAPTQNLTIYFTYTVQVTDAALAGAVEQTFYDWSQLYLPGVSDAQGCAGNGSYNQAIELTISRGDLQVFLDPPVLDRCETNQVRIDVEGASPDRLTNNVVVTFTASTQEILSARNFTYLGGLASVGVIAVTTNPNIGGGRGIITFTLPSASDVIADGTILFDVDIDCNVDSVWNAGVNFRSLCTFTYGDTAQQAHVYRDANLSLFVTPVEYTVRNKEVIWKFFVANTGNLTATNFLATNTLSGIRVDSYTVNSPNVSLLGTLPISGPNSVVFSITQLAPGEQLAFHITGTVFSCIPLGVDIEVRRACFGDTCDLLQDSIQFNKPDPYLLTNNGQTADLPTCDLGHVVFTTKNASADVSLYQLNITETLQYLSPDPGYPITVTIYDDSGNVITTTTSFTPQITSPSSSTQQLTWRAEDAPGGIFDEIPALYVVVITIPVRTDCNAPDSPTAGAEASALGPCDTKLGYDEGAITLKTLEPNLSVDKEGKVLGGSYGNNVYASPGDTVIWRLRVQNANTSRSYEAFNVVLSDTWPSNFVFSATSHVASATIIGAQRIITWDMGNIPADGTVYYRYITGTVTGDSCSVPTENRARLTFGCDDGCVNNQIPQDTADLYSGPNLEVTMPLTTVLTCGGDLSVRITNRGAPAYSSTLTVTVPAGYVYSETSGISLPPTQILTPTPESTVWVWTPFTIPGRVITTGQPYHLNITFRVNSAATNGACLEPDGDPISATVTYDDHPTCISTPQYSHTLFTTLGVLTTQLNITKLPPTQVSDVGGVVTWTLLMSNTGPGTATQNIAVTDTAGTNFSAVTASNGSDGSVPTITPGPGGTTIVWNLVPTYALMANGANTWLATLTATVLATGTNRNDVIATAHCASGCQYTEVASDTAFVSIQDVFSKSTDIISATVGDLIPFNIVAQLGDANAVYGNLRFTDLLPPGLGYVSATLVYTADTDGIPVMTRTGPTTTPAPLQSGPIIWALGDVPGSVEVTATVLAIVQDQPPVAQNGVDLTNQFLMAYEDDGGTGVTQTFTFTAEASVTVQVPVLHIQKTYITEQGCGATLFEDNFNDGVAPGWTNNPSSWSVDATTGVYQGVNVNNSRYNGDTAWTDYSYSAMIQVTEADNDIGLYFRRADGNNYYRLRFRGLQQQVRMEKRIGGSPVVNGPPLPFTFAPGQWLHVEMRGIGPNIEVYVDGQLLFTDNDPNLLNGQIGLFTGAGTGALRRFDDVLVTRLGDEGCFVGAGDIVTYTLTISSHETLPGYNLVITDNMPVEMNFITSTWKSTDPDTNNIVSPTIGATAPLTWLFDQLTGTGVVPPLVGNQQTLLITITAQVSDGVPANTQFFNQAYLSYDNREDGGIDLGGYGIPTRTVRTSGGSHSTGLQTVDGGLIKTVTFSPPPTPTLGTLVTYTIIVPAPPISATLYDVFITDVLDSRLYIEGVTTGGGTGGASSFNGQLITATFASIPHSTQAFITVTARISHEHPTPGGDANSGDVITNSAVMTHANADTITNTNVVTTIVGEPNILLAKDVVASQVITDLDGSALLTYTIRLTNVGNSPAYSVYVNDNIPAGISVTAQYGGDARSGPVLGPGVMTWTLNTISNVAPSNVVVLTYTARLSEALSGSSITNVVDILYHSLTDTIPGIRPYTNTDNEVITTALPSLVKHTDPITLKVGDVVTYHLVFTIPEGIVGMGGPNSYLVDTLPVGVQYITDSETLANTPASVFVTTTNRAVAYQGLSQVITWTFGVPITSEQNMPTVITLSFQAQAHGEPGGQWLPTQTIIYPLTNTVELYQDGVFIDDDDVNNEVIQPELDIDKDSIPPSGSVVFGGDTITYTLTITNEGHAPAFDVLVVDTLPLGIDYVSSLYAPNPVTAQITPTVNGQVVTYTVSQIAAGPSASMVITVVARVTDTISASVVLTNVAAIPYYDSQPDDGPQTGLTPTERVYTNGMDTVYHVTLVPTLTLVKRADPMTVAPGGLLEYSIIVSNIGAAAATGVVITDALPANTTFVTATLPHTGPVGGVITWPIGTLGVNHSRLVTVLLRVDISAVSTTLTNTAWVDSNEGITDTDTVTTSTGYVDLAIVKRVEPVAPVVAGSVLTFSIVYTNLGTAQAQNVYITDTLPASVTFGGIVSEIPDLPSFTQTGQLLTWYTPTLNAGVSGSIVFTITTQFTTSGNNLLTNTVTITNDLPDANPDDNESTTSTPSIALELSKQVSRSPVWVGELLSFTIRLTNTGGITLETVPVTDTYDPTYLDFVPPANPIQDGYATGIITWNNVGPIGLNEVISLVLTFTALTDTMGTPTTNYVTATGVTSGTSTGPQTDSDDVEIVQAVLGVNKQSQVAGGGPAVPGSIISYSIFITNPTILTATNVTVIDPIPTNTSYITGSLSIVPPGAGGVLGSPPISVTGLTITPNTSITLSFAVRIDEPLSTSITVVTNTVSVTSTEVPTPTTDTVTDTVTHPTLELLKLVNTTQTVPGGILTYTIIVSNPTIATATGVVVDDPVPTYTTYISGSLSITPASAGGTVGAPPVYISNLTVAGQSRLTITFAVQVDDPFPANVSVLTNTVSVTSPTIPGPLTDTVTTTVALVDLEIVKLAQPDPVLAGSSITYTLLYTNNGPSDAQEVNIVDTLPQSVTYAGMVSAVPAISGPTQTGQTLTWYTSTLLAGASGQIVFNVTVDPNLLGQIVNSAIITSITSETNPDNNTDTVTTTITPILTPSIQIVKGVSVPSAVSSATVRYTIDITNDGLVPFFPVALVDVLDPGLTYIPGTFIPFPPTLISNGGLRLEWANVVTQPLQPGQATQVSFDVQVSTQITGTYQNAVTVTATYTGGTITDTDNVPVDVVDPSLTVVKEVIPPGVANNAVTYTIRITNTGPSTLTVVPLFDYFDNTVLSFTRATPSPDIATPGFLQWNDLTGPAPNGFNRDLPPRAGFVLTTVFAILRRDFTETVNTAVVIDSVDEYTNTTLPHTTTAVITHTPTGIALSSFDLSVGRDSVSLNWATFRETNLQGFRLLRSGTDRLEDAVELSFISAGENYSYRDGAVERGNSYTYWLVTVNYSGNEVYHGPKIAHLNLIFDTYLPLVLKD